MALDGKDVERTGIPRIEETKGEKQDKEEPKNEKPAKEENQTFVQKHTSKVTPYDLEIDDKNDVSSELEPPKKSVDKGED